jgi:uncharacterized membrane protein HdeD (DUF308 family)
MTDSQTGKTEKKRSTPGYIATIGAGATALAIINMSVGSEALSQPILILQYAALALGLFALVGGLIMMMTQKSR